MNEQMLGLPKAPQEGKHQGLSTFFQSGPHCSLWAILDAVGCRAASLAPTPVLPGPL